MSTSALASPNVLDALFMRLGGTPVLPAPAPHSVPPGFDSPIEEEWINEEKKVLEELTQQRFAQLRQQQALLEQQRAELVRRQYELNETCVRRQQEMNKQIKEIEGRTQAVAAREAEVEEREKKLATELQRLGESRKDLQQFRQETAEQQRELETLKAETLALIERERESRQQLGELERSVNERWEALAGLAAPLDGK